MDRAARSKPGAAAPPRPLLVADSWLVDEGYERAAGAHWDALRRRLPGGSAPTATSCARFAAAARAALPPEGRWFPRVELTDDGFALRLRRAPPPAREARVVVGAPGDPRRCPRRKGPDLELLAGLRARPTRAAPTSCCCATTPARLLEGALSSLLWWEDDALCTTPDERTLPGVTRAPAAGDRARARRARCACARRSPPSWPAARRG